MAKKNKKHGDSKKIIVGGALLAALITGMLIQQQLDKKIITNTKNENSQKETEIKSLINNQTAFVKNYDLIYSFPDVGIYSPLFTGKTVSVVEYSYKRELYKKLSILLSSKTVNIQYRVNIWQMKHTPSQQAAYNGAYVYAVLPDYNSNEGDEFASHAVASLDTVEAHWNGVGENNGHDVFLHTLNFNDRNAALSIEFVPPTSPNDQTYFVQIKPVLISQAGLANFSSLDTNELLGIARSMSARLYK